MKNKNVLITGATAGIGKATAELFAASGYNLILTGRRKDRLEKLAQELKEKINELKNDVTDLKEKFSGSDKSNDSDNEESTIIQDMSCCNNDEIINEDNFEPATAPRKGRALVAGWVEGVRLLDNMVMNPRSESGKLI